jgi:galactokinase
VDDRRARILSALGEGASVTWYRAPGRVNLMGDHTDYNEGFVLPVAIDRDCLAGSRPRSDGRLVVRSLDVAPAEQLVELPADGGDNPSAVSPGWGRYVAAVAHELAARGREAAGLDLVLASSVPIGSGLSSSAALDVACALALCGAADFELSHEELARACRAAEALATGVPCGIMDPLASLCGAAGAALLIDCRSLETERVPLPAYLDILVVHSGLPRALAGSAYAERRAASAAAAERLGVAALRDSSLDEVADDPIARHVVSENVRVLETTEALRVGDLDRLGLLFAQSHASLRDDYRVSTPELDALAEALVEAGAVGARLTGAGFGGCVVALVRTPETASVAAGASERYRAETGLEPTAFVCRAVAGAGRLA